jgi:hypothetical protein
MCNVVKPSRGARLENLFAGFLKIQRLRRCRNIYRFTIEAYKLVLTRVYDCQPVHQFLIMILVAIWAGPLASDFAPEPWLRTPARRLTGIHP